MPDFQTLTLSTDARGVARLMLNCPDRHNAMSSVMIRELTEAATALADDPAIRVVVLTGAGESFCAGGDLSWMQAQAAADRETRIGEATRLARALHALDTLPKPLIGRINGQAYGGGMGLISVCDIAIGVTGKRFGFTETRLGLVPATISPYVLARMGAGVARRVFMSARLFETDEAVTLGLLAQAVPPDALDAAVEDQVKPYLNCAPGAVARAKALVRGYGLPVTEDVIAGTAALLADTWEQDEAREGISAFFDRRTPEWSKRS